MKIHLSPPLAWMICLTAAACGGGSDHTQTEPWTPGGVKASGLLERPTNPSCIARERPDPESGGGGSLPGLLSETGCFEPADPSRPSAGAIPYEVNAALWSDGARKERYLALPDGAAIETGPDGDFIFPIGTVLLKVFALNDRRVETRLFMRHSDGVWAGYSYAWRDDQTDAELLPAGTTRSIGDRSWTFPGRDGCPRCHTEAAGWSLGPDLGQLNRAIRYPETGAVANQLATLARVGVLRGLPENPNDWPRYPEPYGTEALEARARAYLHANCAGCHRPGGPTPAQMDLRFSATLQAAGICDVPPRRGDLGLANARLVAPGDPARSVLSARLHAVQDERKMPPLGRSEADPQGTALLDAWISSLTACP